MVQPLALVFYQKLLPGTQLVNRLQDLKYRVVTVSSAADLLKSAEETRPIVVLADLQPRGEELASAISQLRANPATAHLPVVAFGGAEGSDLQQRALAAGASLIVGEAAILNHLEECLEQALQLD